MTNATKIVCTLGPASAGLPVIRGMLEAGMNVARVNCSHGTHEEHGERIRTFRQACEELGLPPAVLLDTRGPEIRLGVFPEEKVILEKGQTFTLYGDADHPGSAEGVGISYGGLAGLVRPGTQILVDDGRIRMEVEESSGGDIRCTVMDDGPVSTKKGVNVPDVHLDMDYLSERDKDDLLFGIEQEVDFVAASFMRSVEDARDVRGFLDDHGGQSIQLIAKIENPEGIRNFEDILEVSDGIMIARGDMGVEVDYACLPGIQKSFIYRCNRKGKPVITATQMLESMVEEPVPTRAEITDVANAVFDGTSAVMLSGESAAGKYPVQTVAVMSRILEQAEKDLRESPRRKATRDEFAAEITAGGTDLSTAIGHAAGLAAEDIGARALIAVTRSGYTARVMARFHPDQPILAATPSEQAARQLALVRGVTPVITRQAEDWDHLIREAIQGGRERGYLEEGDRVVISAGLPLNESGNTNTLKVETV